MTITNDQAKDAKLSSKEAVIGSTPVVAKHKGKEKISASFIGARKSQFIIKDLKLTSGHKARNNHQIVVDEKFKTDGYKLGDKVTLNSFKDKYQIVGFTKNAKLNVAPVAYGTMLPGNTYGEFPMRRFPEVPLFLKMPSTMPMIPI